MSFDEFINGLSNEIENQVSVVVEQRFPCGQCAGTGRWSGGVNRHGNSKCLACTGRGYFTSSPEFRAKKRASAQAKKLEAEQQLRRDIKAFSEAYPDMWRDLNAGRTDFTRSLMGQLVKRGQLTDNQIAAWYRGWEKLQAAKKSREETVNLDRIREMFDAAISGGQGRPCYRAEGLKITMAASHGSNPNALYVVDVEGDEYQGKISETTFFAVRNAKADVTERLRVITENPLEAAIRYGRATGKCSCCGRKLTNKASIEAGIGPICQTKWSL